MQQVYAAGIGVKMRYILLEFSYVVQFCVNNFSVVHWSAGTGNFLWCTASVFEYIKLENVAINDVLPRRLGDAMPLLTWNVFEAWRQQRPNFDGFIYIRYATPFTSFRLAKFEFRLLTFVCDAWQ